MSENTPTVADFATEVAYTVAIVIAAGVVIKVGAKAARRVRKTAISTKLKLKKSV